MSENYTKTVVFKIGTDTYKCLDCGELYEMRVKNGQFEYNYIMHTERTEEELHSEEEVIAYCRGCLRGHRKGYRDGREKLQREIRELLGIRE